MIINYSVTNYMLAFWEMLLDAEDYVLTLTLKWAFISYDELDSIKYMQAENS